MTMWFCAYPMLMVRRRDSSSTGLWCSQCSPLRIIQPFFKASGSFPGRCDQSLRRQSLQDMDCRCCRGLSYLGSVSTHGAYQMPGPDKRQWTYLMGHCEGVNKSYWYQRPILWWKCHQYPRCCGLRVLVGNDKTQMYSWSCS